MTRPDFWQIFVSGGDVVNLERIGIQILGMGQSMGIEIDQSLTDKFFVGHVFGNPRTIVLGQFPADRIKKIASKKRPGPAYIGLGSMNQTSCVFLEKDTIARSSTFDDPFGRDEVGIFFLECGEVDIQKLA
jgi:hypothetical protein